MDKQYPAYYKKLSGLMSDLGKEIPGPMALEQFEAAGVS